MKRMLRLIGIFLAAILICMGLAHRLYADKDRTAFLGSETGASKRASDDPWSPADLMQPEELARLLSGEQKPVLFQVGIDHLYKISHIPGSKYAGPASSAAGVEALKKQAQSLNRDSQVVCYCGCCPWANCPNTRPAYQALREMGFKKIRMLYLANSFGEDWITKGYPVERGS